MSRAPRRRMNKTVSGPERNMVLRVMKFFVNEKYDPDSSIPISKVLKRTSAATGVSISTIKRIRTEQKSIIDSLGLTEESEVPLQTPNKRKRKTQLEYSPKIIKGLCNIIDSYRATHDKMMPLKDIFEVAKRNLNFTGQKESLRKFLIEELGYSFDGCKSNTAREPICSASESEEHEKREISSIYLDTKLKVEVEDYKKIDSENIKKESLDLNKMEAKQYELDIKEGFS